MDEPGVACGTKFHENLSNSRTENSAPYLVETGRLGVCARVHDVDAIAAETWQHQLVTCFGGVSVAAAAHVPSGVVKLISHSGHPQAVDHLKHGRAFSRSLQCLGWFGDSMRCMEAKGSGQTVFGIGGAEPWSSATRELVLV
jgi:hypothetical protein